MQSDLYLNLPESDGKGLCNCMCQAICSYSYEQGISSEVNTFSETKLSSFN